MKNLLAIYIYLTIGSLHAQCDPLNEAFGIEGIAKISIAEGSTTEKVNNSFIDNEGNIVCIGYAFLNNADAMAVSFHKPDGTINNAIGNNGKITYISSEDNYGTVGSKLANDKFMIAGNWSFFSNDSFIFRKYLSEGTPDETFGVNGEVYSLLQGSVIHRVTGISENLNKEILVTGIGERLNKRRLVFTKLSEAGEEIQEPQIVSLPNDIGFEANRQILFDNQLIISGVTWLNNGARRGALVKLNQNGELDADFGNGGVYNIPASLGRDSEVINLSIINDQTIVTIGYHKGEDNNTLFLRSLDRNAQGEPAYFDNGYTLIDIDPQSEPVDFVMDNEHVYVAANDISDQKGQLYKIDINGQQVNSFGENGKFDFDFSPFGRLSRVHFDDQSNILLTGVSNYDFTIWNFNSCIDVTNVNFDVDSEINVFPNPVSQIVNIRNKDLAPIEAIEIFNFHGQHIKSFEVTIPESLQVSFDISYLPSGEYIICLKTNQGIIKKSITKI